MGALAPAASLPPLALAHERVKRAIFGCAGLRRKTRSAESIPATATKYTLEKLSPRPPPSAPRLAPDTDNEQADRFPAPVVVRSPSRASLSPSRVYLCVNYARCGAEGLKSAANKCRVPHSFSSSRSVPRPTILLRDPLRKDVMERVCLAANYAA